MLETFADVIVLVLDEVEVVIACEEVDVEVALTGTAAATATEAGVDAGLMLDEEEDLLDEEAGFALVDEDLREDELGLILEDGGETAPGT